MRKDLSIIANRYIDKSPGQRTVFYEDGGVDEIIQVILHADRLSRPATARFAQMLRGKTDERTLYNVWRFVRRNIRYIRDTPGHEVIKSPMRTWQDRFGDCKSHSVFVGSLLKNLGYRYFYRVAFYDRRHPEQGHIYAIAQLPGGREIIVDSVNDAFNDEHGPIWKYYDYETGHGDRVGAGLSGIAGRSGGNWFGTVAKGIGIALLIKWAVNRQPKAETKENE